MSRQPTSFKFDDETRALLDALAKHLGLNHTQVIKVAVRHLARREKVRAPEPDKPGAAGGE